MGDPSKWQYGNVMARSSDVQGLGKPLGFKGKGQEGKGQGKDFMTLRKPLPLAGVRGFVKGQRVSRDFYSSNYKVL